MLAHIHYDKLDNSVLKINFQNIIKILYDNEIIVPVQIFEDSLQKVLDERLVGKATASEQTKYAIAQAILNTAFLLAVPKDQIIKHKIRTNQA